MTLTIKYFLGIVALVTLTSSLKVETKFIAYIPYIDLIKNGEKYELIYNSQGCFHGVSETITITKRKDKHFLKYNKSIKEISDKEKEVIRNYESDIYYREFDSGCTTIDQYLLIHKGDTITDNWDGSCEWNGWNNLLENLKLK